MSSESAKPSDQVGSRSRKQSYKIVVQLLLSLLLFYALSRLLDWRRVFENLRQLPFWVFLLGIGWEFLSYFADSYRQKICLNKEGIDLSIWVLLKIKLLGAFSGNFLPSSITGDVIRATVLGRVSGNSTSSWSSTLFARFMGLTALIPFFLVGLAGSHKSFGSRDILFFAAISAVYGGVFFFAFSNFAQSMLQRVPWLEKYDAGRWISGLHRSIVRFAGDRSLMLKCFLLSVAFHICTLLALFGIVWGMNLQLWWPDVILGVFGTSLAIMIPISLNGLGLQDFTLLYFFKNQISNEQIVTMSIVWHCFRIIPTFPGALFLGLVTKKKDQDFVARIR